MFTSHIVILLVFFTTSIATFTVMIFLQISVSTLSAKKMIGILSGQIFKILWILQNLSAKTEKCQDEHVSKNALNWQIFNVCPCITWNIITLVGGFPLQTKNILVPTKWIGIRWYTYDLVGKLSKKSYDITSVFFVHLQ